jgi:hypothetical protein
MIKFILKSIFSVVLLFSSASNAGIIESDLTDQHFITYNEIDWTWASPVNATSWGNNTLYGPEAHAGWRYATQDELNILRYTLTPSAFLKTDENGQDYYVQSVEYWNDVFTSITLSGDVDGGVSITNFSDGFITSGFSYNGYYHDMGFEEVDFWETFYVRDVADRVTTQVPEPSTLAIFAIALIALSLKKRFVF